MHIFIAWDFPLQTKIECGCEICRIVLLQRSPGDKSTFHLVHQCYGDNLAVMKMTATPVLLRQWEIIQKIKRV